MRQVPLPRTAPVSQGITPLQRSTRIPLSLPFASVPVKRAARGTDSSPAGLTAPLRTEFTKKVKDLVRKRAGNGDRFEAMCEAGGEFLGEHGGEFQPRTVRDTGGCGGDVIGSAANCILLCARCHRRAEARDSSMSMDAGGFWIGHGTTPDFDPRNVAILLASPHGAGPRVWLAEGGLGPDGTGYLLQCPEVGFRPLS